jgi:hypothetical protein
MIMESEQNSKRKKPGNQEVIHLSLSRIILAILLTNAAGISLRYFDLDTYFIFLGFRFHLSAVFPFIILFKKDNLTILFEALKKPRFKRKFVPLLWLIISLAVVLILLFLFKKIKPGNPDYFYEFGLSSIYDYPLYLVWNFPQLCLLYITLMTISQINKFHYLNASAGCILLFVYELIPFGSEFNPVEIIPLIAISLTACFFITRLENIYWFSVIIFSSVWSIVLLFGSGSTAIINIFFAKEYSTWEGFFETAGGITNYVIPSFFLIMFIVVLFYVFFQKSRVTEKDSLFR